MCDDDAPFTRALTLIDEMNMRMGMKLSLVERWSSG
jgi:hypothetical protein